MKSSGSWFDFTRTNKWTERRINSDMFNNPPAINRRDSSYNHCFSEIADRKSLRTAAQVTWLRLCWPCCGFYCCSWGSLSKAATSANVKAGFMCTSTWSDRPHNPDTSVTGPALTLPLTSTVPANGHSSIISTFLAAGTCLFAFIASISGIPVTVPSAWS